jgi:peptide/nickel transport system permease protein
MQFGSLLSGAVITETIFSWDGLGRLLVTSIQTRDYPVTQACILIIASSYVFINFLTEGCLSVFRSKNEALRI